MDFGFYGRGTIVTHVRKLGRITPIAGRILCANRGGATKASVMILLPASRIVGYVSRRINVRSVTRAGGAHLATRFICKPIYLC